MIIVKLLGALAGLLAIILAITGVVLYIIRRSARANRTAAAQPRTNPAPPNPAAPGQAPANAPAPAGGTNTSARGTQPDATRQDRPSINWWDIRIWKSIGTLIIMIVVATALWQGWQLAKNHVNDYAVTETSRAESRSITLTTNWWVKEVPFGYNIEFAPETDNMGWDVQINKDPTIYHRPPVNSPEYSSKDYGQRLNKVQVRVSPTNQVTLTGKLQYVIK